MAVECECTDWTMVGYPRDAYDPSWHDGRLEVAGHHPACPKYEPPPKPEVWRPKCDLWCKKPLTVPGALIFSPPNQHGECTKIHCCAECFVRLGRLISGPLTVES